MLGVSVSISDSSELRERMEHSRKLVDQAVQKGDKIYGVTSGFGGMADLPVSADNAHDSQVNLLNFLSTSIGAPLPREQVRAAMLLRANMLLRGVSGVRIDIVERLIHFLNNDATPIVGKLGSIGASGDLVPLAVIARAITGQATSCRVQVGKEEMDRDEALKILGLEKLELQPKEALAIVNGTTFSTAIAALNIAAARNLLGLTLATHAIMARALLAHEAPFAEFVHRCKPHPGQGWVAEQIRDLLVISEDSKNDGNHLQDRYSIRCLPQYIGPTVELWKRLGETIETEVNSITDNPMVDPDCSKFHQSGNFLGQYIGLAMDDLRKHLGLLAKHLDTQIALLVSPEFSHGLPASLTQNSESPLEMNLKGLQILANSIVPDIVHLGAGLVEHFPTHAEQNNQNINGLSWGSAIRASESISLYSKYAAVGLIFAVQAIDLRASLSNSASFDGSNLLKSSTLLSLYQAVYEIAGRSTDETEPLVSAQNSISIEQFLIDLTRSIEERGSLVQAISPILRSLDEFEKS